MAALALPLLVLLVTGPANWAGAAPNLLILAVICALINGPLEELAWRRPFRANSGNDIAFELLGLSLFTLWHLPLLLLGNVAYDYGALGLVGGALILGAIWTMMTRVSDSVGWPILSHTLLNIAAFLPFFATNFSA